MQRTNLGHLASLLGRQLSQSESTSTTSDNFSDGGPIIQAKEMKSSKNISMMMKQKLNYVFGRRSNNTSKEKRRKVDFVIVVVDSEFCKKEEEEGIFKELLDDDQKNNKIK